MSSKHILSSTWWPLMSLTFVEAIGCKTKSKREAIKDHKCQACETSNRNTHTHKKDTSTSTYLLSQKAYDENHTKLQQPPTFDICWTPGSCDYHMTDHCTCHTLGCGAAHSQDLVEPCDTLDLVIVCKEGYHHAYHTLTWGYPFWHPSHHHPSEHTQQKPPYPILCCITGDHSYPIRSCVTKMGNQDSQ